MNSFTRKFRGQGNGLEIDFASSEVLNNSGHLLDRLNNSGTLLDCFKNAVHLDEECMAKESSEMNGFQKMRLLSGTKTVLRKFSDNIGKVMMPSSHVPSELKADNQNTARNLSQEVERIASNDEEFRKLKEQLRATGVVTTMGIKQMLPSTVDSHLDDKLHFRLKRKEGSSKGCLILQNEKCGVSWSYGSRSCPRKTLQTYSSFNSAA